MIEEPDGSKHLEYSRPIFSVHWGLTPYVVDWQNKYATVAYNSETGYLAVIGK